MKLHKAVGPRKSQIDTDLIPLKLFVLTFSSTQQIILAISNLLRAWSSYGNEPQTPDNESQSFRIEYEQETDGRWLAEVPTLPGVMVYGKTKQDAEVEVTALALRVIADRTQKARKPPKSIRFL